MEDSDYYAEDIEIYDPRNEINYEEPENIYSYYATDDGYLEDLQDNDGTARY